jgi:TP901 family phage tail tape measure protein
VTNVGQVSFKMILDTSNLRGEVAKVNALLTRQTIKIPVQLETGQLKAQLAQIAKEARSIKIPVQTAGGVSRGGGVSAPVGPSRFENDFEAALKRQEKEAEKLAREFERTAAAAQRAADQTLRIDLRRQEREAAALAKSTEQAAAAAQRLQQQNARDKQVLSGAKFSRQETKQIEDSLKRVAKETKRTEEFAALLRQKYGLVDAEARQLAGTLGGVRQQQSLFNQVVAGVFTGEAAYRALEVALGAVRDAVAGIINQFQEASEAYKTFEENILNFEAKAGGVSAEITEGLKQEVLRVAAITSQSPQSLSEAAANLVSGGVDPSEVAGRLDSLAKASDVLKEEPELLAKITQSALQAYGDYGVGVQEVSDLIVQAINTSAIGTKRGAAEFEQLFSKAAGVGASLGVGLDELITVDAIFAGGGSFPEARATAVETLLTRLSNRRDKLAGEGVELGIKDDGVSLDLLETLDNIRERVLEIPDTTGRLSFLGNIFNESAANDIQKLLEILETGYADVAANIEKAPGAIERAYDIQERGTNFQAELVQGFIDSARTSLGEALNPAEMGFVKLQQAVLELVQIDLSPLSDGAERLGLALSENPELAEQLAGALSGIAQTVINQVGAIFDALTAAASNKDFIESLDDIGNQIENVINLVGRFVQGVIGAVELIAPLFDEREVLPGVQTSIIGLFQPLNLLKVAAQTIGSVFTVAKDALTSFAERFPLVVQAIKSVLPGLGVASVAVGALIDRIPDRFKGGNRPTAPEPPKPPEQLGPPLPTPEQQEQIVVPPPTPSRGVNLVDSGGGIRGEEARTRAKKELTTRLNVIEEEDTAVRTRLTQQGATQEEFAQQEQKTLNERITARQSFINRIKELQALPGNTVQEQIALESALADAEKDLAGDRLAVAQNFQRDRKQILDNVVRDSEEALSKLDRDNARTTLTTAQQGLDAGDNAIANIRDERQGIQGRLSNREGLLTQLRQRQQAGGLSDEDSRALNQQIVDTEKEIYGLRLEQLNSFRTERQQILDNIQSDSQRELSLLERDQAAASAAIAESPLTDRERTDATVQAEQDALQQRLANQQEFLDELKRQQAEGGLSPSDAQALGDQIISVETGIYNTRTQLANSFEAERKRLAEQGFADQLQLLSQIKEQETLKAGQQTTGIQNQQQLLEADTGLITAESQLDQARLATALATAQAEAGTATNKRQALAAQRDINKLQIEAFNGQVDATARELAAKRNSFELSAKLTRLESQRAIQAAEIAALEADIAVRRAIAAGATQQEVTGLQQVASLLQEQIDVVKQSAVVTDQVLSTKAETLTIEEQIAEEQLKQNGIIEQGTRLMEARRGMISALAAESSTTPEEGIETLDRIRERFRDARGAGLFQGENVNGAIGQVESALRGGNDRRLFQLAQSDNPLISQLIDAAGRSDITGLVAADKELALAKSVEDGNTRIVDRLDTIIEQGGLGARIENLIVATPDPVADTSRIVSDVANLQTAGVNV